ncbi:MAG: DUF1697 domain-containing protein [Chloroflexi bacterium]|nr:DUF1697 domain-containing protein [Chloroflexota bacterium]
MPVYVSLLRGINVGGNKRIKMADLKGLYEALGLRSVSTLLQSGNVVFESDTADASGLTSKLEAAIVHHFGFESKVMLRSGQRLAEIVAGVPLTPEQLAEPSRILVTFLRETPSDDRIAALHEAHAGPEKLQVRGDTLYAFYPDGMGPSKLDNAFVERRLKTLGTGRSWNTVTKLLALVGSSGV